MEPSPEAIAWGKRQATRSPRWSDRKWKNIGTIFGVELTADQHTDHDETDQPDTAQDAA